MYLCPYDNMEKRRQKFAIGFILFLSYYYYLSFILHSKNLKELTSIRHHSGSAPGNSADLTSVQNCNASGLCSQEATDFGCNQRVVSFSLFGNPNLTNINLFTPGLYGNLKRIREYYPGWLMRVYTNISLSDHLPSIISEKDFFLCDISQFPILVNNREARAWRFLPILDPTVDVFLIRDLDSLVGDREQSAVKEWLDSEKIFHAMRDHPWHGAPMLAGMWGGKNYAMSPKIKHAVKNLFAKEHDQLGLTDQQILTRALYIPYQDHIMVHDSYLCQNFPPSFPFPEQRKDVSNYVGSKEHLRGPNSSFHVSACPVACRPSYGKNWTYC